MSEDSQQAINQRHKPNSMAICSIAPARMIAGAAAALGEQRDVARRHRKIQP